MERQLLKTMDSIAPPRFCFSSMSKRVVMKPFMIQRVPAAENFCDAIMMAFRLRHAQANLLHRNSG
jgi:hypothetical protein